MVPLEVHFSEKKSFLNCTIFEKNSGSNLVASIFGAVTRVAGLYSVSQNFAQVVGYTAFWVAEDNALIRNRNSKKK